MKKIPLLATLATVVTLAITPHLPAAMREEQWRAVDDAIAKGLPQTGIERLESIIEAALAEGDHAEAVRAIGRKIVLEGVIQGNKPEEKIRRLEAEMEKAPAAMRPMLEALLAHWYWHFFQQNRWRFLERTQTATEPGPDILTWDLARILAEIDQHFTAALADETTLKATPVSDWDELLESGSAPDSYRPTLFDFLAYEALAFYQAGEQGAISAENPFLVEADGPIFDDVDAFLRWQPTPPEGYAPELKAIRLYQKLLAFHRDDADRSAFYDADLARIDFGGNVAVGTHRTERYEAALRRFIEATASHEISARALEKLARSRQRADDLVEAHALASRGLEAFPNTAGGAACYNLIQEIEAKSASLTTEFVWNEPWPTLDITYKNITHVWFRAYRVDFEAYLRKVKWGFGHSETLFNFARRQNSKPALIWDSELPATEDYTERTESLPAPTSLAPGFYVVAASHQPKFYDKVDNQVSVAAIWVSDLALVLEDGLSIEAGNGGFVLDANTGEPVAGAEVQLWQRTRNGSYNRLSSARTDKDGRFRYAVENLYENLIILARSGDQAVSSTGEVWVRDGYHDADVDSRTVFFTDRAIYRPGQSIHYKGICILSDQEAGNYTTLSRTRISVSLRDPNGEEVARATHVTNDYGSFSGVFTAPRDRLTGHMTIHVDAGPGGSAGFRVEEYKRPKFRVEIEPPVEAAKLEAPVALTGKATAYTGAPIGGAQVKWRVERNVRLPPWCWWWQPPTSQAIAHGTAVTDPDGSFAIEFPAEPDRSVPEQNEPVFVFSVHADVTDSTGETRSADFLVRAGYTALQASLDADAWQTAETPVKLKIRTVSLDDVPQSARGKLTIHALQQPEKVHRKPLAAHRDYWWLRGSDEPPVDPANPDSWEPADVVFEEAFSTGDSGAAEVEAALPAGIYRASIETQDRFGKRVTARHTVEVLDPSATHYGIKAANRFIAPTWSVEPGETFSALWGTGYDTGRAFVEITSDGKSLQAYWTDPEITQVRIEQAVTEELRGGFTVSVTFVRENRAYFNQRVVSVPWSNKELSVKWESFRSKLLPGAKETWTALVTGPDAERAAAEMVATLYDASLDQFVAHDWPSRLGVFRTEFDHAQRTFQNQLRGFDAIENNWRVFPRAVDWSYRHFPSDLTTNFMGWGYPQTRMRTMAAGAVTEDEMATLSAFSVEAPVAESRVDAAATESSLESEAVEEASPPSPSEPDLDQVQARTNLNETAFFFPHLLTDEDGAVRIQFTMPEALTEWKFLGFAHDQALRAGLLTDTVVTAKDLMVEPNPPRFVREGDEIEFTVKVTNRTDEPQSGKVRLTFADAATLAPVDEQLANTTPEQAFTVPAQQSRSYSWRIAIPDGMGFLTYKAVGASARHSDGEEGFLPVLSRRILVTESLPLPIRGKTTKTFEFEKLLGSGASDTLRHQALTVQMTSQPAWYAVLALPYLMEFPHECSEQLFNRLYANALARHIANADPKIRRVFELWKNTPALDSPLEKNEDLKSVMIEETPWLRQTHDESQARRNIGLLFDENRLNDEIGRALFKLTEQQLDDGLWPWFPGGRPNEYISLYIITGFGRLRHLGVEIDTAPAVKALEALDAWIDERYHDIPDPDDYVLSYIDALYLYGRSFFLEDQPVDDAHREAVDFYLRQARRFWLKVNSRQSQAHLALALQRFGDKGTPPAILRSFKERAVVDEELGMFWRDLELSWWWFRAPIETQAMMIEAFAEVAHDDEAVENCKVWLLKQKQTQDWKTTKATADAVYGLLLRGADLLASDALVEVALGDHKIEPKNAEAGTGFYEQRFAGAEVEPAMGRITVRKVDDGVSWGGVHWQYLEDVGKITPHEDTPLTLKKALFIKENTSRGPVLKAVTGPVAVGDELVVRIELRTDRDMEYVHLKDQRGSGTEPVNVLSRYRYQDGLAYYESTRDTASHFFIDYLPKGTYVFEYSTRVQLRGTYQTGIAEIQCMYAPEFNSHSESLTLEVQ